jgi:hypothetical protein
MGRTGVVDLAGHFAGPMGEWASALARHPVVFPQLGRHDDATAVLNAWPGRVTYGRDD